MSGSEGGEGKVWGEYTVGSLGGGVGVCRANQYRSNCGGNRKSKARRSYVYNLLKPEN